MGQTPPPLSGNARILEVPIPVTYPLFTGRLVGWRKDEGNAGQDTWCLWTISETFLQQTFWIGATPPPPPLPLFLKNHCFSPQNYRKNCNEIFWIGNNPHPLQKFSENSSKMVHRIVPKLPSVFHYLDP